MPVKFVVEGGLSSMYVMVCASCMCGIGVMVLLRAPLFPSVFANLLPWMFVCAQSFRYGDFVLGPHDEV